MQVVRLCIGVAKYAEAALRNPVKDATDMAAQLERCGIDASLLLEPDILQMKRCIYDVVVKAKRDTELAIVYFAGHGAFSAAVGQARTDGTDLGALLRGPGGLR
jgi:uncharacterized caspase-like protein